MSTNPRNASFPITSRAQSDWRERWRLVRDLLSGALILAVWLALWSWLAVGVAAPLGRATADLPFSAVPSGEHQRS